jgi:hypothetical protein
LRDRAVQSFRIILTIIGLVLFAVYSVRATSASTDRKVSGMHRFAVVTGGENLAVLLVSSPIVKTELYEGLTATTSQNSEVRAGSASDLPNHTKPSTAHVSIKHRNQSPTAQDELAPSRSKAEQTIAKLTPQPNGD